MNQLEGTIKSVQSSNHVSIVDVEVDGDLFTAIVMDSPNHSPYLTTGHPVHLLFKETEVPIGKQVTGFISLRNHFQSKILRIEQGDILTQITMDYHGKVINSIISSRSVNWMKLTEQEEVHWFIKATELSIVDGEEALV